MLCRGQEVRSRTYYILGTDLRLFQNVAVQDPRQNSVHYLVLGCFHEVTLRENQCYLGMIMWIPFHPPR